MDHGNTTGIRKEKTHELYTVTGSVVPVYSVKVKEEPQEEVSEEECTVQGMAEATMQYEEIYIKGEPCLQDPLSLSGPTDYINEDPELNFEAKETEGNDVASENDYLDEYDVQNIQDAQSRRKDRYKDRLASIVSVAHGAESKENIGSSRRPHEIPDSSNEEESESSAQLHNGKDEENNHLCTQKDGSHLDRKRHKRTESKTIYVARMLKKSLLITGSKHDFACPKCTKKFNNRSNFVRHLLIHREEKEFLCPICEKSFTLKQSLRVHIETHMKQKPFSCTECSMPFSDRNNLRRHMLRHNKKREFSCDTCSKTFSRKQQLETHMLIHKNEKPFSCQHCPKAFARNYHLQRHLGSCEALKPVKLLVCSICSKVFPRKYNLERHMKVHE